MPATPTIRRAHRDDAPRLLAYLADFWSDGCDTVLQMPVLPDLAQERAWLAERDGERGVVFVAEEEGAVVGLIDAAVPGPAEFRHTCVLGMCVLARRRGRGIGRALLERLLDWAAEKGLRKVELEVFATNAGAIALYADLGFVEDGRREGAVRLRGGSFCDLVHMGRFVGDP